MTLTVCCLILKASLIYDFNILLTHLSNLVVFETIVLILTCALRKPNLLVKKLFMVNLGNWQILNTFEY